MDGNDLQEHRSTELNRIMGEMTVSESGACGDTDLLDLMDSAS